MKQNIAPEQKQALNMIRHALDHFRWGDRRGVILEEHIEGIVTPQNVQKAFDTLFSKGGYWDDDTCEQKDGRIVYWIMSPEQFAALFPCGDQTERREGCDDVIRLGVAWAQEHRKVSIPKETFAGFLEQVDIGMIKAQESQARIHQAFVNEGGLIRRLLSLAVQEELLTDLDVVRQAEKILREEPETCRVIFEAITSALAKIVDCKQKDQGVLGISLLVNTF